MLKRLKMFKKLSTCNSNNK